MRTQVPFIALGRYLYRGGLVSALRCLLGACWVPHAALDGSRLDFGGVWGASGEGFEGPWAIISDVLLLLARLW